MIKPSLIKLHSSLLSVSSCYLIIALLANCACPADKKLGEVQLVNPRFLNLSGTESMTYTNATTKEKLLFRGVPMEYNSEKVIAATLCSKPPFSQQISYYESVPFASKRYTGYIDGKTGTEDLHYYYKVQGGYDTTSYADVLSVSGYNINLLLLASDRGKPSVRSLPYLKIAPQFRLIADTVINNQRYQQVYYQSTSPPLASYFTSDRGIIAFFRNNAWWYQTGFQ